MLLKETLISSLPHQEIMCVFVSIRYKDLVTKWEINQDKKRPTYFLCIKSYIYIQSLQYSSQLQRFKSFEIAFKRRSWRSDLFLFASNKYSLHTNTRLSKSLTMSTAIMNRLLVVFHHWTTSKSAWYHLKDDIVLFCQTQNSPPTTNNLTPILIFAQAR